MNIDKKLVEDIENKKKKIVEDLENEFPERKRIITEGLHSIGDSQSYWIENPDLRQQLLLSGNKHGNKEARQGIACIHNAWHYLLTQVHPNVKEGLSRNILCKTNKLVRGSELASKKEKVDYRDKNVTLNFPDYNPPKPSKVPELIEDVFSEMQSGNMGDLETAFYTHLNIAGIQPFRDGNKRVSRLVQDAILYQAGYPPAVIYAGEAPFYLNLLREALVAQKNGELEGQRNFYNFLGSKVNSALDEILGDLDSDEA